MELSYDAGCLGAFKCNGKSYKTAQYVKNKVDMRCRNKHINKYCINDTFFHSTEANFNSLFIFITFDIKINCKNATGNHTAF